MDPRVLERMRDVITHRGPDEAGIFVDANIGLGHRRLSIVDVAGGHQAMTGADVLARFEAWWSGPGQTTDFARKARVYYGDVTLHEFLERTTWHSGQHVRQIIMVLGMLGIAPDGPIGRETFAGLPMPDKVWDDERPLAST